MMQQKQFRHTRNAAASRWAGPHPSLSAAATALGVLREATSHAEHELWPLDAKTPAGLKLMATKVKGYRQWTDALLLWQAMERDGVFVTFDSGAKTLAVGELRNHLWLLKDR